MKELTTAHGTISFPAFFPVTTFGDKHPLDGLVRPYLKRTNQCLMLSHFYAQKMKKRPNMPIFIDSGGFAGLFEGSEFIDYGDHASIKTKEGDEIKPLDVLRFQEKNADLGATLDFIIPPKTDETESERRLELTLKNARYALANLNRPNQPPPTPANQPPPTPASQPSTALDRPRLPAPASQPTPALDCPRLPSTACPRLPPQAVFTLYASLQCWGPASAEYAAREYVKMGYRAIAIGGMVPRASDPGYLTSVVAAVRHAAPEALIHVFGIGSPKLIPALIAAGADSFDSSGYIRAAVNVRGKGDTPTGLHANLYAALERLNEINKCFGAGDPRLNSIAFDSFR